MDGEEFELERHVSWDKWKKRYLYTGPTVDGERKVMRFSVKRCGTRADARKEANKAGLTRSSEVEAVRRVGDDTWRRRLRGSLCIHRTGQLRKLGLVDMRLLRTPRAANVTSSMSLRIAALTWQDRLEPYERWIFHHLWQ